MKALNSLIFVLTISLAQFSLADEAGVDAKTFRITLKNIATTCPDLQNCEGYQVKVIYSRDGQIGMNEDTYKVFNEIAFEQAQIWGDTILEGDYHAAGDTRLDQVAAIYQNDVLMGYHITYSETAWDTANCAFDSRDPETLKDCVSGRISESSFVAPSLKTFFRDLNQFAEFKAKE